jgi:hypothetical protein
VTFCLLSFKGPDLYSLAGGPSVCITTMAETLSRRGFETHLFFVPAGFCQPWAGSSGLEFFLGNSARQAVFQLMIQTYNKK